MSAHILCDLGRSHCPLRSLFSLLRSAIVPDFTSTSPNRRRRSNHGLIAHNHAQRRKMIANMLLIPTGAHDSLGGVLSDLMVGVSLNQSETERARRIVLVATGLPPPKAPIEALGSQSRQDGHPSDPSSLTPGKPAAEATDAAAALGYVSADIKGCPWITWKSLARAIYVISPVRAGNIELASAHDRLRLTVRMNTL